MQQDIKALEGLGQQHGLIESEKQRLSSLISEQWDVRKKVEGIWRHNSRLNWCKLGDRNTKFFHNSANLRKSRNSIRDIEYNGKIYSSPVDVKEAAVHFFSHLFTMLNTDKAVIGASGFKKTFSYWLAWLKRLPTIEKVKQVVRDCDGSKALARSLLSPFTKRHGLFLVQTSLL